MRVRHGYSGSGSVVPVDDPVYLVEIWLPGTPGSAEPAWQCAEYELHGADVADVVRWAQENTPRDGRSRHVVYACAPAVAGGSEVHIRLAGSDPSQDQDPGHTTPLLW